ncbi:period circadian protein homolog 2 isoform X1 [Oryzias melastigma]|uniref:period circadian protein homolog 2 isoform X1 n=1 Tax=Oryzias melastigma TaxID=30732 RepID=UPI000CF83E81|nr:period circadian protein homolog 2 isoform X1 [Oryzias melastigma]
MSEDSDSKLYCFSAQEDQDAASDCRASTSGTTSIPRGASVAQLHRLSAYGQARPDLGLPSEGSDSSGQDPHPSPRNIRKNPHSRLLPEEDMEMKSSGSSGSGTESHGNESHGNDSNGNESHSHESLGSSNGNSKDSALLESSGSHKSSNSHSPSPPSSSNAFSLLSSEQDNPSTSGCSSQESAKAKTQKEVLKTLKELKLHLPEEKRHNSKSTTLNTLKYALRCVKQVEANEEYYQLLMINDSQPSGLDVSSYTIEEIDSITSEYTLKNNDIFAVVVSLITGRIIYISDQAASILNCKRDVFTNSKFVEFLTPQDVSVFYSFTTPYRLPSWSMCTGAESSQPDCMQEKSFFCRISGGKESEGDLRYYPFRMTPYLMKVQDTQHSEDQFCCLLLAERVHSGYDGESLTAAPRIPTDKRIFTTTHTPSCVFQDVDERAVPLLGYLPQDLIGTQILLHLHPNDRQMMLAIHKKIVQYAGQPFDHSSIRFCAQNGEYIILDTSWSSFVNPWSRKVSFVIGKHKVRMGPVNEDIFMSPVSADGHMKTMDSDVQELTEQIHRLLLQPVHNSSGYSSLNSNDHLLSLTCSSESLSNENGSKQQPEEGEASSKTRIRSFQEICKGIHRQKSQEQQSTKSDCKKPNKKPVEKNQPVVRLKDSAPPINWRAAKMDDGKDSFQDELAFNDQGVYSYQQISCLDSVIRYLESCNVPVTMKRKCQSSSNTTSSNSDEDKQKGSNSMQVSREPVLLKDQSALSARDDPDKKSTNATTAVVGTQLPLSVPNKPESVVSITSQCSYSSTIVHVGDKKPQPESEITEDVPGAGEVVEYSQNLGAPPCVVSPPSQGKDSYKKLGLTKEVLAAHTQKEEQLFLFRFKDLCGLDALKPNCSQCLEPKGEEIRSNAGRAAQAGKQERPPADLPSRRGPRKKKTKSKRAKRVTATENKVVKQAQPPQPKQAPKPIPASPPEASQSTSPTAYPSLIQGVPLQLYPTVCPSSPHAEVTPQGFADSMGAQTPPFAPMMAPFVALLLPNYMYPPMGFGHLPPFQPVVHAGDTPIHMQPFGQAAFLGQGTPIPQSVPGGQNQFSSNNSFAPLAGYITPSFYFPSSSETPKPQAETVSRSTTPLSVEAGSEGSPPLFQSRCSSPLNLLELELSVDKQDNPGLTSGGQGSHLADREKGTSGCPTKERDLKQPSLNLLGPPGPLYFEGTSRVYERLSWDKVWSRLGAWRNERSSRGDDNNSDAISSSSDMLDIILQEDSCSATSGSMGSGSNGCGTSASGTSQSRTSASGASASGVSDSRSGSNNSSKYFGSVDSSQSSQKLKNTLSKSEGMPVAMEQSEQVIKCVLQDPLWLLMANTDETTMMTYQLPLRNSQNVLAEDKEKLRLLQKCQPRFSEDQRKELVDVHPWMKKGGLPKAIDIKGCSCCSGASEAAQEVVQPELDLSDAETGELSCLQTPKEDPLSSSDKS